MIKDREILSNAIIVSIGVDKSLTQYMIAKGSVAMDGISLTINTRESESFSVSVIPHTARLTTIGFKNKGDRVNIETDMIGKYVERFITGTTGRSKENRSKQGSIDQAYLVKTGFID